MHRSKSVGIVSLAFAYLLATAFLGASAQPAPGAQSPASNNAASQTSAQTPAAADSAAVDSTNAAKSAANKTKKVWTNEEVTGISSSISVVGDAHGGKAKNSTQTPPTAQYIATTRKQLEKLRGQIADADKELATLKSFKEGEPVSTSDREFHKNYGNQPIDQQVSGLEAKKRDLQSKIDALLDEARKKGVEPGELR